MARFFPIAQQPPALSGKKIFHRPKPSFSKGVLFCQLLNLQGRQVQQNFGWEFPMDVSDLFFKQKTSMSRIISPSTSTKPKATKSLPNTRGLWKSSKLNLSLFHELLKALSLWGGASPDEDFCVFSKFLLGIFHISAIILMLFSTFLKIYLGILQFFLCGYPG